MTTYTILTGARTVDGSIKNWVNKDDIPVDTIIDDAEAWVAARLRIREMIATDSTTTLAAAVDTLALPTGYLATKTFMIISPGRSKLSVKSAEEVEEARYYDDTGILNVSRPSMFYTDGTNAVFNRTTDKAYTYRHRYYQEFTALSGNNESNFLTLRGIRMFRCVLLAFASEWKKDKAEAADWFAKAEHELNQLHISDDLANNDLDVLVSVE